LLAALDEAGVRCVYRYVYGPGTVFPIAEAEDTRDYRLNVLSGRPAQGADTAVVYGQGDVFHRNLGGYKVGFTMLEVDGFPADWVAQANRMDEVWVPSEFNRRGFLDSGLRRPIHVIPLGVDVERFHPEARTVRNPDGDFVFLASFEWGERKEPWLLLRAFNQTFDRREPVRLVCKVNNRDPNVRLRAEIARLGLREDGGRISYLFNLEFPHHELPALYRAADCFLAVSRGEGWDMPLMEAMACGLPSIATDWGAHREFVHAANSFPLRITGTIPAIAKCPYYEGFRWADPDEEHLRHLLRFVFENQTEARALGAAAALEMRQRWTWRHAADRIVERLAAVAV
jgi:glycosyltransferase involved in cell wall biosynthesis